MVNNCLVTKLKGTVNNTDLKYLNGIVVERKKMDDTIFANMTETQKRQCRYFYFVSPEPYDLKIIEGNTYFTDSNFTVNYGKEMKGVTGSTVFIANADDCKVLITDNYKCSRFLVNNDTPAAYLGTGMTFDLSDFKYRTNLEKICLTPVMVNQLSDTGYEIVKVFNGDIQNLANCVNLKYINSRNNANLYGDLSAFSGKDLDFCVITGGDNNYPNLTGNIEVFASMPSLTTLDLHYSESPLSGNIEAFANNINIEIFSLTGGNYISANNIKGNLNTLLDAWYTNGKRGNVTVGLTNTQCTYNGAAVTGSAKTFVFNENGWSEQA